MTQNEPTACELMEVYESACELVRLLNQLDSLYAADPAGESAIVRHIVQQADKALDRLRTSTAVKKAIGEQG